METSLIVTNDIMINAATSKVWNALTNPQETKKYMYGCETVSDWKVGSPLLWKGTYEEQEMVFVKGNIARIQPFQELAYTTIDPNNPDILDKPENYLLVTYHLEDINGQTHLTVTQGDYTKVARGREKYDEAVNAGGWSSILEAIKKQVEETV
jgi:uncharacterized protein YndB with AHSA1/START domain